MTTVEAGTPNGPENALSESAVESFQRSLRGEPIPSRDAGYDAARRVGKGSLSRRVG
ncbi:MAG: hypothetical protein ABI647_26110 [Gemmatimonadota bacterium]